MSRLGEIIVQLGLFVCLAGFIVLICFGFPASDSEVGQIISKFILGGLIVASTGLLTMTFFREY